MAPSNFSQLIEKIRQWGQELGFQQIGITDVNLSRHEPKLQAWLDAHYHGEMAWMARHGMMRARPHELVEGTTRVICARMDYLPPNAKFAQDLSDQSVGYISRYALGRDYHKLVRSRLKKLAELIDEELKAQALTLGYRPFVDSAPLLERPLAEKAGLGWVGKHSLLLSQEVGSWFFLGEILIDLPLPIDKPVLNQCGKCSACMTSCPTKAIVREGVVDARRCISYLTIEFDGVIPLELRPAIGNRIYGCDDCQLVCPFNRFSQLTKEKDFHPRPQLINQQLITLFRWTEAMFLTNTQGSPIRRIGFIKWQRNLAIAMGNAPYDPEIVSLLQSALGGSTMLDQHLNWAIEQQLARKRSSSALSTSTSRLIRIINKGLPRDA